MEAPVLNKDLVVLFARDHHACQVNARHIRFERLRVERGLERFAIERNPQTAQKIVVRVIARQRENKIIREFRFFARLDVPRANAGWFDLEQNH